MILPTYNSDIRSVLREFRGCIVLVMVGIVVMINRIDKLNKRSVYKWQSK